MDWSFVSDRFREHFRAVVDPDTLETFLSAAATSADGRRLVVCLLIDVAAEAVTPSRVARLIAATSSDPDPVLAFGKCIELALDRDELTCASAHASPTPDVRYVRVMELSSFITHYVGVARNLTLAVEDVSRVRREYFGDPPAAGLGDLVAIWSGYNGIVWVMPHAEFREIVIDTGGQAATALNDQLGLGYSIGAGDRGLPEIIAVTYPETVTCDCRQPTTLDARWLSSNYYVSFGRDDNWGRTQPCSGSGRRIRERVHRMLPSLTNDFTVTNVGLAEVPPADRDRLLDEAFSRLAEIEGAR